MSKRMFYDPWCQQYVIVNAEEIERISSFISNIYEKEGLATASSREVYLIRNIDRIKKLKKQYVDLRNERKLLGKENEDFNSEKFRDACRKEFLARDLLLSAIDDIVI